LYQTFDTSLHGVAVNLPANDREIPGSTPGRYDFQIKITSEAEANEQHKSIIGALKSAAPK